MATRHDGESSASPSALRARWPALLLSLCAASTAFAQDPPSDDPIQRDLEAQASAERALDDPVRETPPARHDRYGSGKLVLTSGVSSIEGAAGGGLVPWAVIGGYGTRDQVGGTAFASRVDTGDYSLDDIGLSFGLFDRVELSVARQRFDTRDVGESLGLGDDFRFTQTVVGAKVRLAGHLLLDQDTWLPQLSLGVQIKRNDRGAVLDAIGARDDHGTDVYLAATKLLLRHNLLLNGTLRATKGNQSGLLGFGGDRRDRYRVQPEFSAAYLLSRTVAIGAEYRFKPDDLRIAMEDDWFDVFVAWAPSKHVSLTLAYVDLGRVIVDERQRGLYASLQAAF